MDKTRLDVYLVNNGHFESREKAQSNILAGNVSINNMVCHKPSAAIGNEDIIDIRHSEDAYSSRGGNKLEKAFAVFQLDVKGLCCIDVGASTGGFTDCLLKNGARKVYAVDVGYGQLDYRLRTDERVVVMERTNARYLRPDMLGEAPSFATIDVSFISLEKILPALSACLTPDSGIVSLVKPQFEAGKAQVGKNGVVRDSAVHKKILSDVSSYFADHAFGILDMTFSPLQGPKGNIEFLIHAGRGSECIILKDISSKIDETVENAHSNF